MMRRFVLVVFAVLVLCGIVLLCARKGETVKPNTHIGAVDDGGEIQ